MPHTQHSPSSQSDQCTEHCTDDAPQSMLIPNSPTPPLFSSPPPTPTPRQSYPTTYTPNPPPPHCHTQSAEPIPTTAPMIAPPPHWGTAHKTELGPPAVHCIHDHLRRFLTRTPSPQRIPSFLQGIVHIRMPLGIR